MKLRLIGLTTSALTIAFDQWSKLAILDLFADPLSAKRHIEVIPGFFDLVLWWNKGISFGMLGHLEDKAPIILSVLALVVCSILAIWQWGTTRLLPTLALGLIIGGAIGNVIDRLRFGAVVDFLYFYQGELYWPAFNIADSAVCIGVVLLLLDNLRQGKKSSPDAANSPK